MKHLMFGVTFLVIVSLVGCTITVTTPIQTNAGDARTLARITPTIPPNTVTQRTPGNATEEVEIRNLVETFGRKLRMVSLLAPDAAQEIQEQYAEFVSPSVLERWMSNVSNAPGRKVSSPWPDRIEITALSQEGSDRYEITGFVVEVTSTEIGSGEAAAKTPVQIVVQRVQGHWLITEYAEEQ